MQNPDDARTGWKNRINRRRYAVGQTVSSGWPWSLEFFSEDLIDETGVGLALGAAVLVLGATTPHRALVNAHEAASMAGH